ncbi:MAG TPA: hypothetical protein VGG97_19315 [Bryobacteraceae bacterium]|jgi:hypothetical protein
MKYIATMALMLSLGVANAYAHDRSVKMTSSGTATAGGVDLKIPNTTSGENDFAGNGNLGSYTFREIEAETGPQASSTCSGPNLLYTTVVSGAGVFRFQDGSLLNVTVTEGADCIDLAAQQAHCTRTFKIISGTGRFKEAKGILEFTETIGPVLADATGNPVFFASTGEFTGTISGVAHDEGHEGEQQ